jgi:hypothetical protein
MIGFDRSYDILYDDDDVSVFSWNTTHSIHIIMSVKVELDLSNIIVTTNDIDIEKKPQE